MAEPQLAAAAAPPAQPGQQQQQQQLQQDEANPKPPISTGLTIDTVVRPCPPFIAWSHHAKKELGIASKDASTVWNALPEEEKAPWMETFRKDQQLQREQCEQLGITVKELPKRRPAKSASAAAAAAKEGKSAPSTPSRKRKSPAADTPAAGGEDDVVESPSKPSPARKPSKASSKKAAAGSGGKEKEGPAAAAGPSSSSAASPPKAQVDIAKMFPEFLQTAGGGPLGGGGGAFDSKTILQVNRTKRLIARDSEVPRADKESVALINAAAELFVKELSRKVGMVAAGNNKKVLRESDVVEVLEADPRYQFLRATLIPVLAMSRPEGDDGDDGNDSEAGPGAGMHDDE